MRFMTNTTIRLAVLALAAAALFSAPAVAQDFQTSLDVGTSPPTVSSTGRFVVSTPTAEQLIGLLDYPGAHTDENLMLPAHSNVAQRAFVAASVLGGCGVDTAVASAAWWFQLNQEEHVELWAQPSDAPPDMVRRYQATGARPVRRVLRPIASTVTSESYSTEAVDTYNCDNRTGNEPITCTAQLSGQISDTVSSTTSTSNSYTAGATVTTGFRLGSSSEFGSVDQHVALTFSFNHTDGLSHTSSHTRTLTHTNTISVTEQPGESTTLEMTVRQGKFTVVVDYDARWEGDVVLWCKPNDSLHKFPLHALYDGTAIPAWDGDPTPLGETLRRTVENRQIDSKAWRDTINVDAHTRIQSGPVPHRPASAAAPEPAGGRELPVLRLNVDPATGARQDIVMDQDLKNGLSSVLEFVAEGFRLSGDGPAREYLLSVSRDVASGRGHPAPNPGPVTPPQ